MKKLMLVPFFAGFCTFAAVLPAGSAMAQGAFQMHTMDFDIWCTEEQHLPYERCAKRTPEDIKNFEAYSHIIEKYEMRDVLSKQHTLSIANIRNAADSDEPASASDSSAPAPKK